LAQFHDLKWQEADMSEINPGVNEAARAARAQLVVQAPKAVAKKTPPPVADGHRVEVKPSGNSLMNLSHKWF
jgi:hypothetical protein